MLELRNIVKQYLSGENTVNALNGVSLRFRESEFVSILGKSGCGKTTMLNIIGGLDRYTSGDLIINGKSTKEYKDGDWDVYRNRSIGFVFQSYNLIPHQTVLANVELALTLSGVSKAERRERAKAALEMVGLGDQLKKKPSQMSGGQMQRVAIARALVNDPDILLADEPTGALDSHTSVQIMEILAEVAKKKLVIMVTHNPDLAEEYSTRIVRLSDGEVISDSAPYAEADDEQNAEEIKPIPKKKQPKIKKKPLTLKTALSLSLNNLMTKKARTVLTSFAGSIGIIGIALILALSNGIQLYINRVQEDTLSTYPLTISAVTQDYSAMLSAMTEVSEEMEGEIDPNKIYIDDSLGTMMSAMSATKENDLVSFKKHLDEHYDKIKDSVSDIQYTYDFDLQIFTEDGKVQVSPTEIFDNMGPSFSGISEMMESMGGFGVMSEMINNQDLLDQQYELVGENSHWPTSANEVVLVVNSNNQIAR
jgi:putative ABC transport system permease protein